MLTRGIKSVNMTHFFISYARSNAEQVGHLINEVEKRQHESWDARGQRNRPRSLRHPLLWLKGSENESQEHLFVRV